MSELVVRDDVQPVGGVLAIRDPELMLEQARTIAVQLKKVVAQAGLIVKIQGRDYLTVEAWTTLGVLVGCTARTEWSRPIVDQDGERVGWEAAVEVVNSHGLTVGRAEAECLRSEKTWSSRDDYAIRSMSQTRAMGKALRMPLGWIAVLAGYDPTPAEEMPRDQPADGSADPMITAAQRGRLFAVAGSHGVSKDDLRQLVLELTGQDSTKFIPKTKYDELIAQVEAFGVPFD